MAAFVRVPLRSTLRPTMPRPLPARAVVAPARPGRASLATRAAAAAPAAVQAPAPVVSLTDRALAHLRKLRRDRGGTGDLLLRVAVRQGGCSGMSYSMDFTDTVNGDDHVVVYDAAPAAPAADDNASAGVGAFRLVIDPKSLLFLFGLQLDYSDELIGGGFKFANPNSTETCGCGKSFNV